MEERHDDFCWYLVWALMTQMMLRSGSLRDFILQAALCIFSAVVSLVMFRCVCYLVRAAVTGLT